MSNVKLNLKPLQRFRDILAGDLRRSGNGPIRVAMKHWAKRYRSFAQERFVRFSRGGGDWPPLRPQTVARRRKGKGAGPVAVILKDTDTLSKALIPEWSAKPGAIQLDIPFGVRVGYGGPARHAKGGKATIADIARFHHEGAGRLPKREIIVEPPTGHRIYHQMAGDMERAMGRITRGHS